MPTKEIEVGDTLAPKKKKKGNWRARLKAKRKAKSVDESMEMEDDGMEEIEQPKPKIKGRGGKISKAKNRKADKQALQQAATDGDDASQVEVLTHNFDHVVERIPSSMTQEMEQVAEYRQMFETLSRMARIAEKKYLKDKLSRDMYAALKAYAEMREIIADMRALADFTEHANRINEAVVTPLVQSSAAALVEYNKAVLSMIQKEIDSSQFPLLKKYVDGFARDAGMKIKTAQDTARGNAAELFVVK